MTAAFIAKELKGDILTGKYRPGAELQQAAIAERFGVSRIPVRDALALLAVENLVDVKPNRGAHVIALTKDELLEIYELRILLECSCIEAAVVVATAEQVETIEYEYKRSCLEAGRPGWQHGDWSFHKALYMPAGKKRLMALIEEMRQTCQLHIAQYDCLVQSTEKWISEHKALVDAYRQRDTGQCVALVRDHLDAAMTYLLQSE